MPVVLPGVRTWSPHEKGILDPRMGGLVVHWVAGEGGGFKKCERWGFRSSGHGDNAANSELPQSLVVGAQGESRAVMVDRRQPQRILVMSHAAQTVGHTPLRAFG